MCGLRKQCKITSQTCPVFKLQFGRISENGDSFVAIGKRKKLQHSHPYEKGWQPWLGLASLASPLTNTRTYWHTHTHTHILTHTHTHTHTHMHTFLWNFIKVFTEFHTLLKQIWFALIWLGETQWERETFFFPPFFTTFLLICLSHSLSSLPTSISHFFNLFSWTSKVSTFRLQCFWVSLCVSVFCPIPAWKFPEVDVFFHSCLLPWKCTMRKN